MIDTTLAVAGLSARSGVELAQRSGMRAIALDLFGDQDTQHAAQRCMPIGEPSALRIDGARFLAALSSALKQPDVGC